MKTFIQQIIDYGLLATLILFPLSVNIAIISPADPGHPVFAINFSIADFFIGILLILWIIMIVLNKEWGQVKFPPVCILVFAGAVLLSFVKAESLSEWAKESVQIIEYFVLFFLLLLNNFKSIKRKTILYIFYISTSIFLLIAFIQHSFLDADVYLVRGLFENRNILGVYLCMAIPLIYAEFMHSKWFPVRIWMAALMIFSILILVSGSAILAILISLGAISWKFSKKVFLRYLIAIVLLGPAYTVIMPKKNLSSIKEFCSIYEQGSISENYYRRLKLLGGVGKFNLLNKKINDNSLQVTMGKFFESQIPEIQKGEGYKELEGKKQIKNRYLEMQASLNMISKNALLGVGAGNFQGNIGTYYKGIPKVNTAEPGQNNGYLIIASTTGLLGLASVLWMFFSLLKNIQTKNTNSSGKKESLLQLGLSGAILSCMIENFFVYIFSASLMIPFVFIIYLSSDNIKDINCHGKF